MIRDMKASLRSLKRLAEEIRFRLSRNPRLNGRYQLPSLLNARGLRGIGVEVGVYEGWFSDYLLTHWRGNQLISVDPWQAWGAEYTDDCNQRQQAMDQIYTSARQRLQRHGRRSDVWRLTGEAAAARFSDEALDFVYIDAQHHEAAVTADLHQWYPKVKAGGMLAGHDYMDGAFSFGQFGVKSAVDKFVRHHQLGVHITRETDSPSWFIFKP